MTMQLNTPRPRDVVIHQLGELHQLRDQVRGQLIDRLHTLDAIDRRIDRHLDQLGSTPQP